MDISDKTLNEYLNTIQKDLETGKATEPSHYSTLKILAESFGKGINALNQPKRIECGAPDFIVSKGSTTVGYVEAKDIGKSLDEVEKSNQLKRYRDSLTNLILTDYLEFRWYLNGEKRLTAHLGTLTKDNKIKRDKEGMQKVAEILDGFFAHEAESVGTPKELAGRMARLAHMIREIIIKAFEKETESGSLHSQYSAFRESLIPDLSTEQFADMYAQTIAYGLFAARCTSPESKDFTRQNAAYLLPKTNPFLRKLFNHIAGPELDDRITWAVDELAQVLRQANMEAVLKDFGKRTAKEDPVVHFYETFLQEYDPKVREMRGVYYTPEPVVSYIVRSIDYILKTRFDKSQGLADTSVLILDPAVGTATFLYNAIKQINEGFINQGQTGMWNDYVAEKLLTRIFGFELLMAPYAVAHLKLGLLLQETGYQFKSDQRLGIYLTNTLEEAFKKSEQLAGFNEYIVDEANAAAEIKKDKPIMIVLGNPPYSGHSANKGAWAKQLVEAYKIVDGKPLGEKNPKWLQDDYVKFIRFGQWRVERTGQGILGFITNHSYLDNPTFRGMRQSLMNTFTDIYILDLHGNTKRREVAPDGSKDENVFDIQQGVAIGLFIKDPGKASPARVHHADLWGLREGKYHILCETDVSVSDWKELQPNSPFHFFVPRDEELLGEYEQGWKITDVMPINSVNLRTHRDSLVIDFDKATLERRIETVRDRANSDDWLRASLGLHDNRDWSLENARNQLRQLADWKHFIRRCHYRPFDFRWIFYDKSLVEYPCYPVVGHFRYPNIGFTTTRQTTTLGFEHILATECVTELKCISHDRGGYSFPLYVYAMESKLQTDKSGGEEGGVQTVMHTQTDREPNLNPDFIKALSDKLGMTFIKDAHGELEQTFSPEDIFNYAYAVFHSPTYRSRYAEFLKIDFPRLPLTANKELFKVLAAKGADLVALHLMESPILNNLITRYPVADSNTVEKVSYYDNNQRVYINKEQYFEGVPPEVWEFHIGGYQVCDKWLKDRKGRKLTIDEAQHYQKIVVALRETIRLMAEIDSVIPGWPME